MKEEENFVCVGFLGGGIFETSTKKGTNPWG
jgi:hypothetical protein